MLTKPFKPLALAFLVNLIIFVEDKIKYKKKNIFFTIRQTSQYLSQSVFFLLHRTPVLRFHIKINNLVVKTRVIFKDNMALLCV